MLQTKIGLWAEYQLPDRKKQDPTKISMPYTEVFLLEKLSSFVILFRKFDFANAIRAVIKC